jgi:hypothetical protein
VLLGYLIAQERVHLLLPSAVTTVGSIPVT